MGGITTPRTDSGKGLMEKSRISSLLSDVFTRDAHAEHTIVIYTYVRIDIWKERTLITVEHSNI